MSAAEGAGEREWKKWQTVKRVEGRFQTVTATDKEPHYPIFLRWTKLITVLWYMAFLMKKSLFFTLVDCIFSIWCNEFGVGDKNSDIWIGGEGVNLAKKRKRRTVFITKRGYFVLHFCSIRSMWFKWQLHRKNRSFRITFLTVFKVCGLNASYTEETDNIIELYYHTLIFEIYWRPKGSCSSFTAETVTIRPDDT